MTTLVQATAARAQPVVNVTRLGFVAVETPDVDAMASYYVDDLSLTVVERTADAVYLTTGAEHHCVVVESATAPRPRARLGLRVDGPLGLAEWRLRNAGLATERRSDPEPGIADALVIHEPGGTPLWLYEDMAADRSVAARPLCPTKLGHVASFVRDIPQTQRFYEDVLGFRWSDTIGDFFVFLRCGRDHHAVNFLQSDRRTGVHHIAYEARDWEHFKQLVDHVTARDRPLVWGPGRHGAGHNIFAYHRDPDGTAIEIFTEIDLIADEATGRFEPRPWHEQVPQGPRVWEPSPDAANKWGPVNLEFNDR